MEKNGVYEGVVSALGSGGEGIIKIGGTTAFVPFCLVGERVRFTALRVRDGIAYGKLVGVLSPSPERVQPRCPVFGRCGGCNLQHMSYRAQLKFKREYVANTLKKIGGIEAAVDEVVPCDEQYGYRNKLVLPIGDGEVGFYAPRSHRIVPVSRCDIQSQWSDKVFEAAAEYMRVTGLSGGADGVLRHIVARRLREAYIFVLVARRRVNIKPLERILARSFKEFTLLLNVNSSDSNVIFSNEWHICRGEGFYTAEEQGIRYRAGANTFVQVNDSVRAKLYGAVLAEAAEGDAAIDLYSGGGMLTAMLAEKCGRAYGIELVEEASRCADELKELNGQGGRMFNICGAVEDVIDDVLAATSDSRRVIVCDPPRKGMERSVMRAIARSGVEKVVLISCNPATLARDLGLLCGTLKEGDGGLVKSGIATDCPYDIAKITPFDMFPQTAHVETLVVLSHKKPDSHIEVKIDMDDTTLDTAAISERAEQRKPKDKPTYKKIQSWVEENYGFKVHTGYIAEVKRNEGLPMYDAPNAAEELKRPRPHPTPQMVEAIKTALKYFEII